VRDGVEDPKRKFRGDRPLNFAGTATVNLNKNFAGISRGQTLWRKLSKKVVREELSDFRQFAEAILLLRSFSQD